MKVLSLLSLVISLILTGCTTLDIAKREDVAKVRTSMSEELIEVKQDIRYLKGKIEELQQETNNLSKNQIQQNKELNTTLKEWRGQTKKDIDNKISNLKNKIETIENNQEKNRKNLQNKLDIVLEEVSKENRELRRQIEAIRKGSAYSGSEGYYVVTQGDTLSGIAQMFGVSMKNIMDANNISNPNSLQVGQKLIVPERN